MLILESRPTFVLATPNVKYEITNPEKLEKAKKKLEKELKTEVQVLRIVITDDFNVIAECFLPILGLYKSYPMSFTWLSE